MDGKNSLGGNLDSKPNQMLKGTSPTTEEEPPKYIECEGFMLPVPFKNILPEIKIIEIRDDDIWLCTYPKCGSTWVQEMIWCIANGLDHQDVKKPIDDRFPFLERSAVYNGRDATDLAGNSVEDIQTLASPRFIKTHLPFNLLPEKLQDFSTNAKIIHVLRNPKDTIISQYHYHKLVTGCERSLPKFLEMFLTGNMAYCPFPAHLKGYLAHGKNPKILFLSYEEMSQDLKTGINKIANFMGRSVGEEDSAKILEHLSFSNMKRNPAVNQESTIMEIRKKWGLGDEPRGHFMRRGVVGDWKQNLDPEQLERISKWEAENFQDVNFKFSV